jgi:hypothetical protein
MDVFARLQRQKAHKNHKLEEVAAATNRNDNFSVRVRAKRTVFDGNSAALGTLRCKQSEQSAKLGLLYRQLQKEMEEYEEQQLYLLDLHKQVSAGSLLARSCQARELDANVDTEQAKQDAALWVSQQPVVIALEEAERDEAELKAQGT